MKSVKPGRGPSMMGAIGSLCATAFGIVWTVIAYSISPLFSIFGVIFVILGIVQFIYNLHNTRSKDRFSVVDITDDNEESDPLNDRFESSSEKPADDGKKHFCPYCGERLDEDFLYCPKCGRKQE